ncbi:MAG TPA: LysM peptidoglycan-binding domain-containing protein, partial [Anaerolineales bacterium]|nr:LysM peptidoglycan-binding domain-containing protein [Anaerolineales bacterium]
MSHTPPHVPSALLRKRGISLLLASFLVVLAILACSRGTELSPEQLKGRVTPLDATSVANVEAGTPLAEVLNLPPTFVPTIVVVGTPTPDPTQQGQSAVPDEGYFVQPGDTFGSIATNFGISLDDLLAYNNMSAEDLLVVGQMILIPRTALAVGPDTKLIPDSELVYSPASARFDVVAEVNLRKGYLVGYTENDPLNGELYSGAEMVRLIAQRYSVNPRLLLAVLEYESGWVTNPNPAEETLIYPMGNPTAGREGLSRQLSWAANRLNAGYYGWLNQSVASIPFADGSALGVAPGVNAGTVAVQYYFSALRSADDWRTALAPAGFLATY